MIKFAFENARKALDFLESHQLNPSAVNYDLALNYIAFPASELAQRIDAATDDGLRLTAADADQLVARYLSHHAGPAAEHRDQAATRHAEELGVLTSDAHTLTSALERDVGSMVAQSTDWPEATGHFVERLSVAERELADLRGQVATLHRQMEAGGGGRGDTDRDQMTQALNQDGAQALLLPLKQDGQAYVLILFSLDNLVAINAQFGRSVGDNVLNALAGTLRHVFPDQQLIRWAGNEFVILMQGTALITVRTLTQEALTAMEARRLKLRGSGQAIGVVTASAGIAMGQGEAAPVVLERARALAATAALAGGNRYEG